MDAHIDFMSKPSNREKILSEGLRVVHERGFGGASVRDIVQAAGVPQGSFSNHFRSKEAFGLEILDLYLAKSRALARETLGNAALSPLERLAAYVDTAISRPDPGAMRNGCLIGNFTAQAGECGEAIRCRLAGIFADLQHSIRDCLLAAVQTGELPPGFDCDEVAGFVVASMQGAILLSKAEGSPAPVQRLKKILFTTILSWPGGPPRRSV